MKNSFIILLFLLSSYSCNDNNPLSVVEIEESFLDEVIELNTSKIKNNLNSVPRNRFPILTNKNRSWRLTDSSKWTSGFYPGLLWYTYHLTEDQEILDTAIKWTTDLESQKFNTTTHDIGFMMMPSYGNYFNSKNDSISKQVLIQAAESLITRYDSNVKSIQSWNGEFKVIIDNMMNLELLFWAYEITNRAEFLDIAVSHAYTTLENHIRSDGGTFHVVHYNKETGRVTRKRTHQGYADWSTWARGQAWAIYGFSMAYNYTGDKNFLISAKKVADYFIKYLPNDYVPYWDFNLPISERRQYRDTSAGAIAISGLIKLDQSNPGTAKYKNAAEKILHSLINNYISSNENEPGLLIEGAYNLNSDNPNYWNASTIWGDYYFIEAIISYKETYFKD